VDDKDLEDGQPENYCVTQIMELFLGMDGMNHCMSLGILECVKQNIFEMMAVCQDEEDDEDGSEFE